MFCLVANSHAPFRLSIACSNSSSRNGMAFFFSRKMIVLLLPDQMDEGNHSGNFFVASTNWLANGPVLFLFPRRAQEFGVRIDHRRSLWRQDIQSRWRLLCRESSQIFSRQHDRNWQLQRSKWIPLHHVQGSACRRSLSTASHRYLSKAASTSTKKYPLIESGELLYLLASPSKPILQSD